MRVALAWSSGKDSAFALHELRARDIEVASLFTTVTTEFDRVSMHGTRRAILVAQAEAAGLPLHQIEIPYPCPNEVYEAAMARFVAQAKQDGITHLAFGDLFLEDIRRYREAKLAGTGLAPIFPLWGRPTAALAQAMIASGLDARVVCLDPKRVDPALAGSRFDQRFLDHLSPDTDPCGENGEFHTCVVGGPIFARPIKVTTGEVVTRDGFVFTDLAIA